jgi:hypothetical protein
MKPYTHYLVYILLPGGYYKMHHLSPENFDKCRFLKYRGVTYKFERDYIVNFRQWCPWLSENVWNSWRTIYNQVYAWWHETGMMVFPVSTSTKEPVLPIDFSVMPSGAETAKWTPALVRATARSTLYKEYDKRLSYGGFRLTWKVLAVLVVGLIVVLLIASGKVSV